MGGKAEEEVEKKEDDECQPRVQRRRTAGKRSTAKLTYACGSSNSSPTAGGIERMSAFSGKSSGVYEDIDTWLPSSLLPQESDGSGINEKGQRENGEERDSGVLVELLEHKESLREDYVSMEHAPLNTTWYYNRRLCLFSSLQHLQW